MHNNKGQALIIFVLLLPLFVLFLAYVFDVSRATYEKNKIKSIGIMTLEYAKEHNLTDDEIKEYISKNDSKIVVSINRTEDIKIQLIKEIDSLFSKYIDKDKYRIKVIVE